MLNNADLEKRLNAIESKLNGNNYSYCFCSDERIGNLIMNNKTKEIERYEDDLPINNKLYFILFPELIEDDLINGAISLDTINPFDLYYFQQVFGTINNDILMKRIRKWNKSTKYIPKPAPAPIESAPTPLPAIDIPIKPIESMPVVKAPAPKSINKLTVWERYDFHPWEI